MKRFLEFHTYTLHPHRLVDVLTLAHPVYRALFPQNAFKSLQIKAKKRLAVHIDPVGPYKSSACTLVSRLWPPARLWHTAGPPRPHRRTAAPPTELPTAPLRHPRKKNSPPDAGTKKLKNPPPEPTEPLVARGCIFACKRHANRNCTIPRSTGNVVEDGLGGERSRPAAAIPTAATGAT